MLLVLAATAVLISLQVFGKVSRDLFLRNPSGLWIGNRGYRPAKTQTEEPNQWLLRESRAAGNKQC
jgi:hypothetical protein